MNISDTGVALIKHFEGFRNKTYLDSVGVPTIGWGTTRINGEKVRLNQTCTEAQATEWMKADLAKFVSGVSSLVKFPINQSQFDALVSFAYNLGLGNFGSSTLLKLVNKGQLVSAASEFVKWNRAGGVVCNGLTKRRTCEAHLFSTGKLVF